MRFSKERITKMYQILKELSTTASNSIEGFQYCMGRQRPDIGNPQWIEYTEDVDLSQLDEHIWFHKIFATPMVRDEIEILFELKTGREDNWAATNPQALVYLNGQIIQGMDTNHTEVLLEPDTEYEVFIEQASTGKMKTNLGGKLSFSVELGNAARVEVKIVKC